MEKYFSLLMAGILAVGMLGLLTGCGQKAPEELQAEIQSEVRSEIFRTARYDVTNSITTEAVEAQYDMVQQ